MVSRHPVDQGRALHVLWPQRRPGPPRHGRAMTTTRPHLAGGENGADQHRYLDAEDQERPSFSGADRTLTGACAVLVALLSLIMVPLYFVYSGPPPANNVLTRNLITVVVFAVFLIF